MPKFTFKLEAVLRHRKVIEQEKQRDHALALAKLKALQDQLNAVNQSMQDTNDDVRRNHLTGKLDLGFITAHRRFLLGMQRKGMEILAQMAGIQKEVEATRAALAEAAKQRKIL